MSTYYVSKGATNGFSTGHDTNNNGLAMATPFLTISKAVATAVDGDSNTAGSRGMDQWA